MRSRLLLVALVLLLPACSSSTPSNANGAVPLEPGNDGGGDGRKTVAGDPRNLGEISLFSRGPGPDRPAYFNVGATFNVGAGAAKNTPGCETIESDACEISICATSAVAKPFPQTTAGDIGVSVGATELVLKAMTPDGYDAISQQESLWTAGETIQVHAPGRPDGAPAFDVSLEAPALLTLTEPRFVATEGKGTTVVAGEEGDVPVQWTSSAPMGQVEVLLATQSEQSSIVAVCRFESSGGNAVIPEKVMANFPRDASTKILISAYSAGSVDTSGWRMSVRATTTARTPEQLEAQGTF